MSPIEHRDPSPDPSGPDQRWVVILDAEWSDASGERPPTEAMVGGWPLRPDGTALAFQPNPEYRPSSPGSATDLVDAAARMVVAGRAEGDAVLWALRDSVQWLAVDEAGAPAVDTSPDGVRCVLVTTSGVHRERIDGPQWREVTGRQLAELLPEGTDVLVNLGGPAAMRLVGDVVRAAMTSQPAG